jgi:hypothetical protein
MKKYPQMNYSVWNADGKTYADFDNVAFEGPCKVIFDKVEFYGGKKSKPYEGELIVNPTWGQLFIQAMKQQQNTLDFHHVFLEGAEITATVKNGVFFVFFCFFIERIVYLNISPCHTFELSYIFM